MIIANVMTRNPIFASPDMSVNDARALMTREKIGKLPVLDKNNRLVGIVTKKDLVKAGPSAAQWQRICVVYLPANSEWVRLSNTPCLPWHHKNGE